MSSVPSKSKLPVDVSSFKIMREDNYVYIDKTQHIYHLITEGRLYFLARPRRFGKSLLISTFKELFSGNRSLFKGLWIDSSDYQWQEYPVIHIDFSTIARSTPEKLEEGLSFTLQEIAKQYGIDISIAPNAVSKFSYVIKHLATKGKVVVLIDEYDKPILDHITNIEHAMLMRNVLKEFYEVLKGVDEYIRALLITGVTKFARTSIFSGLNNLIDLTLHQKGATVLGYTDDEIATHFDDYIKNLAQKEQVTIEVIKDTVKKWYNGYQFSKMPVKVYNPFSVLYCFMDQEFTNYWFRSGTPSFLIHLIKQQYYDVESISMIQLKAEYLEVFELDNISLVTLLFQSGYLTISEYDQATNRITVAFPNYEVEDSFTRYIVVAMTDTTGIKLDIELMQLLKALNNCDIEQFCTIIKLLFSHIPYTLHVDKEKYYHSLFQFLMSLLSLEVQSEVLTNIGRVDMVVNTRNYLYIFEFKYNKDPQEALAQIYAKKYYEKYMNLQKKIILVGIAFKSFEHEFVVEYVVQEYKSVK